MFELIMPETNPYEFETYLDNYKERTGVKVFKSIYQNRGYKIIDLCSQYTLAVLYPLPIELFNSDIKRIYSSKKGRQMTNRGGFILGDAVTDKSDCQNKLIIGYYG